jgi:hypothetical protein
MMTWLVVIVVTALAGSLVQDLFLPKFLRQADETLMKEQPKTTEHSILAMVLTDMESLDLISLSPNKKPVVEGKPQTDEQHPSEKAAA